jgi:predicted peroxiredoxin
MEMRHMVLGRIKGVKEFAKECKEKGIEFNLITALISKNYRKQNICPFIFKV